MFGRVARGRLGRAFSILLMVIMVTSCASLAMAQGGEETGAPESVFHWFMRCNGLIGLLILFVSIFLIAWIARLFFDIRMETAMPTEVLAQCEAMLEQRDFKGIFNVVKEDDSLFSRLLVTGITNCPTA